LWPQFCWSFGSLVWRSAEVKGRADTVSTVGSVAYSEGVEIQAQILNQSKKAQGESNDRLDALLAEVKRTNELLAQLLARATSLV
jgi:hypothetical protein